MKKIVSIVLIGSLCLSACTGNQKESTDISYGENVKLESYFKLNKGETISSLLTIDSKIIGIYDVNAVIVDKDKKERKENRKLTVKDSEKATIKLLQNENKTYEIPFKASFNVIGNIDKIEDKVDGEYKEIDIVTKEVYEKEIKTLKDLKNKAEKQIFTTNESLEEYKNTRARNGYTLVTSDVNVEKEGTYVVEVCTIDKSYNITEISYALKVVKEGEKVSESKLAVGVDGTKMGKATSYTITNKTNEEAKAEPKKEEETSLPTDDVQSQQKFENNIVTGGAVSSQGSPVLQAALNYVGSHMMCDELATMALVNGGYLTGTPESIFRHNGVYNIGVYQMPAIGSYISEGQAVPGDLILYDNGGYGSMHVAVYAGNGKAVHGGYNGANVVVSTVYLGSGPRYFRVAPMTWSDVSMKVYGHGTDSNGNVIWPETKPPTNQNPSTNNPGGNSGSGDSPEVDDPWGDIDFGQGNATYTYTYNGSTSVSFASTSTVDSDFVYAQLQQVAEGTITREQMVANLLGKGYTVTG
ncbi:NlpC/P60 family protein [Amedibacillus sp. YH-ame10]